MPSKRMRTEQGFRPSKTDALRAKQTGRRRSGARNRRVVIPRDKLGFATSMVSTLRYVDRVEFAPVSTTTAVWSFRANDLYDPFTGTGGHQPRGFDEMMAIYNNFTVTSSKCSVNWMLEGYDGPSQTGGTPAALIKTMEDSTGAPAVPPVICGVMRSAEGYGSGIPVDEQMEKDRTTWKVMTPQTGGEITSTKSGLSDFFGKQDLVAAEGYGGTASGGPDNEAMYHLFCARGSDDYPAGTVKVVAYVTIEYRATFTEPKPLQAS